MEAFKLALSLDQNCSLGLSLHTLWPEYVISEASYSAEFSSISPEQSGLPHLLLLSYHCHLYSIPSLPIKTFLISSDITESHQVLLFPLFSMVRNGNEAYETTLLVTCESVYTT